MTRLRQKFFNRDTVIVAKELLGKHLFRKINGKVVIAKITETEAYCGQSDLANHASKGLTERTKIMFGPPGRAYVYLIYGMHHCLNVVTEKKGYPAAVLIRRCELVNSELRIMNNDKKIQIHNSNLKGPGILCRELKIDRKLNGVDLCKSNNLWIKDGGKPAKIKKGKRIGVDYAGKWKNKLWRFYID